MKKVITLLISAGLFTATYAQRNKDYKTSGERYSQNTYGRNDNNLQGRNAYRTNSFQKREQLERIDRQFKYKVMAIQQNRYMNNRQKRLSIRDAKNERNYKIQMLNNSSNGYADRNYGRNQWK